MGMCCKKANVAIKLTISNSILVHELIADFNRHCVYECKESKQRGFPVPNESVKAYSEKKLHTTFIYFLD